MALSVPDELLHDGFRDLVGAAVGSTGTVSETLHALGLEASDPLVAGLTTDAVVTAEIGDGVGPAQVITKETAS
jgi:hypothetical protein